MRRGQDTLRRKTFKTPPLIHVCMDKKSIVAVFLVFVMVSSTLGFVLDFASSTQKETYGDWKFTLKNNAWVTSINGVDTSFSYLPSDVESLSLSNSKTALIKNAKQLGLSYDPRSSLASSFAEVQYDLAMRLDELSGVYVVRGLVNNSETALPILTCENATLSFPVIVFEENETTEFVESGSCIHAGAIFSNDVYRLGDRLLYGVTGVIQ